MVFGDFNMNYLNDNELEAFRLLMQSCNFNQVVTSPTYIAGSLLDHVYVSTTSLDVLENAVVSVYYSDHDAVKLTIKYKK